jgi:hypothetical protein
MACTVRDTARRPISQENFKVIRRVITALNDRDIDGLLRCCTEDAQLRPGFNGGRGVYEGRVLTWASRESYE